MRGLHAYILGGGEPKCVQSQELAATESKKFGFRVPYHDLREAFGPRSETERAFWRFVLRAWMNGRNPRWMVAKFTGAAQHRLGWQEKAYF